RPQAAPEGRGARHAVLRHQLGSAIREERCPSSFTGEGEGALRLLHESGELFGGSMAKQKSGDIVVGLDIGTTKICAIVGELTEGGIDIIGIGTHPSKGLR